MLVGMVQNENILLHDMVGILAEKVGASQIEVLVPSDGLNIVEDGRYEGSLLDIQVFEAKRMLEMSKLVEKDFLDAHSIVIKVHHQGLVVSAIRHQMEFSARIDVCSQVVFDVPLRRPIVAE
jgi:hypothetical protein